MLVISRKLFSGRISSEIYLNMVEGVEPEVLEEMRLQIELGAVHFVVQVQHQQNSAINDYI